MNVLANFSQNRKHLNNIKVLFNKKHLEYNRQIIDGDWIGTRGLAMKLIELSDEYNTKKYFWMKPIKTKFVCK